MSWDCTPLIACRKDHHLGQWERPIASWQVNVIDLDKQEVKVIWQKAPHGGPIPRPTNQPTTNDVTTQPISISASFTNVKWCAYKLDQQLPDYLRALWTYATPLCIRFVFISFVEECLNIVLHMVAVIDQRVINCRFIGEFSYSVSFLTIIFQ